jgi:8-oxo-dGTP pyrophosphatase MutT (NUDIX family)
LLRFGDPPPTRSPCGTRRRDQWGPGGQDPLGTDLLPAAGGADECAIRDIREETGVTVEVTELLGIFSGPGRIVAYGDGEIRQEYEVVLLARPRSGTSGQ